MIVTKIYVRIMYEPARMFKLKFVICLSLLYNKYMLTVQNDTTDVVTASLHK